MASGDGSVVTLDTNIAIYAMTENAKLVVAESALSNCEFLSVQVLNEYANATMRKRLRTATEIRDDLSVLVGVASFIAPILVNDHHDAIRIADRYQISFYDALLIAVALANGATTLYSEDMHHGLVVDAKLTIIDPFLEHQ